jgi:hypothetical protein
MRRLHELVLEFAFGALGKERGMTRIAALGLPPDFDPAPPPAAPHPAAPPASAQQSLLERVRSLHLEVCGAEMPAGIGLAAGVALVEEGVLGGVREGGVRERVGALEELLSG